ncbi:MAG: TIGR00645 family protein [Labrys sp. (in: a-proteobacteria)]
MAARLIERVLFAARWLMVFFYAGLLLTLLVLLVKFAQRLYNFMGNVLTFSETDAIVSAAAMIDLTLVASMILIVVYSGYENFVSQLSANENKNWPEWMTRVDFTQLKQKLLASIVLISSIQVLKAFMEPTKFNDRDLMWIVGIHLVFVLSTVAFALSDLMSSKSYNRGRSET